VFAKNQVFRGCSGITLCYTQIDDPAPRQGKLVFTIDKRVRKYSEMEGFKERQWNSTADISKRDVQVDFRLDRAMDRLEVSVIPCRPKRIRIEVEDDEK
jgi:hypothetical protein